MSTGYPDVPVLKYQDNKFHTDTYVDVMTEFIKTCDTPMTIAIQGDWGTGKTSMMNMIQEKLGHEVKSVMFNTWQYSQFNLGDQLPILLINKLVNTLAEDEATKQSIKGMLKWGAKLVGNMALGYLSGGAVSADFNEFNLDQVETLINMKESFEKIVKKAAARTPAERVVVFVDDLDRLQPQKAVEVLEVLKVFLDCENCVFVLAVDYSVVSKGVSAKYGEAVDDEKGRSFFDKIIQLPFKMPVAQYAIDDYLKGLMSHIWGTIERDERKDIDNYLKVIECTIGKNPRSIKRTVNSFTIINNVAEKEKAYAGDVNDVKKHKQKLLFCLLCMQLSCEPLYNYLMQNTSLMQEDTTYLSSLKDDASFCEALGEIYEKEIALDDPIFKRLNPVIDIFVDWADDLMNSVRNNPSTQSAEEAFLGMMSFSSITSSSDSLPGQQARKDRTSYFAKLKIGDSVQTITFRSAKRNAASLGALAYVLIKQYVFENNVTANDVNQLFSRERLKGSFLDGEETILFPVHAVQQFLQNDALRTEHMLTHYYVNNYRDVLKNLIAENQTLQSGATGMQETFGPIQVGEETCFVARYWSEADLEKLHKALKTADYVSTDPNAVRNIIDAFSKEELDDLMKRKSFFEVVK